MTGGYKHTEENKLKISLSKLGEKNPNWKGDKVGYRHLHRWVITHLPKPELCQFCVKRKVYDLANVTGDYTRSFDNWKYLCRSCHMKYDYSMGIRVCSENRKRDNNGRFCKVYYPVMS